MSKKRCDGIHTHVEARGKDCKLAEEYTDSMVKRVHTIVARVADASSSRPVVAADSCCACAIVCCSKHLAPPGSASGAAAPASAIAAAGAPRADEQTRPEMFKTRSDIFNAEAEFDEWFLMKNVRPPEEELQAKSGGRAPTQLEEDIPVSGAPPDVRAPPILEAPRMNKEGTIDLGPKAGGSAADASRSGTADQGPTVRKAGGGPPGPPGGDDDDPGDDDQGNHDPDPRPPERRAGAAHGKRPRMKGHGVRGLKHIMDYIAKGEKISPLLPSTRISLRN